MKYSNSPLVTYTNISKNKTPNRQHAIDTITIHVIVGQWTAKQGCDYFATTTRECSANYFVGKDGDIGLCVEEKDRSWCSSNAANDHRAVTIETASDTTHPYAVTDAAYYALIDLVADICKRNGKTKLTWLGSKERTLVYKPAKDEMVLTVHRWFANKACPGEYLYSRHGEIANTVTEMLQAMKKEDDTVNSITVGDIVKITGERYYGLTKTIPAWVKNKQWIVSEVRDEFVIVDKSTDGLNSIKSPIDKDDIQVLKHATPTQPVIPPVEKDETIKVGDKVKIVDGAYYYGLSKKVPYWVLQKTWIVSQVKGDCIIIDKSTDNLNSIRSPIHVKDLTKV